MNWIEQLKTQWLAELESGQISGTELAERILRIEYSGQGSYQADIDRQRRCGFGEVIYGQGKSPPLITSIARKLMSSGCPEVLVTRVDETAVPEIGKQFAHFRYDMLGRTLRLSDVRAIEEQASGEPRVAVVCAGSTDLPVAREALDTLAWMGVPASSLVDVGVAGPYRLLPHLATLRECLVIIVVAGMEGALASVMGGLVAAPIIAVPTSVGYGANLQGITTLLSMLSSCAAGVTVVNIDAGFKAGYIAGLMVHQCERFSSQRISQHLDHESNQ